MLKIRSYLFVLFAFIIFSCSKDDDGNDTENSRVDKRANQQTLGTSARDFLTADNFISIQLEIAYVQGFKPTQESIDGLVTFLKERCNKPANITIKETVVAPTDDDESLDIDEIVQIESDNRTVYNTGDELAVWVFFADNNSEKDEGNSVILGTAYRNTSCIIFEKTIREQVNNNPLLDNLSQIEGTSLHHEFGHLFGLVDLGTPMLVDHQDTTADDNGTSTPNRHCDIEGCLMYYQTVSDVFSMGSGEIAEFDELCLADLRANGGK
ncbi:hypothetical protein [Flavimarina sp. Hel_I_48]|uniref:hypothetical protein n=1 Tax=Flavimarina sp. Hel_I_48 TaxID=1392488 RepID=UPI0004DF605D|nr:hypothetical protein [Flavimarina sp. Hel_I_48]